MLPLIIGMAASSVSPIMSEDLYARPGKVRLGDVMGGPPALFQCMGSCNRVRKGLTFGWVSLFDVFGLALLNRVKPLAHKKRGPS